MQSGDDLFSFLFGAMMTEAEASAVVFGNKDLNGLWGEIMGVVDGRPDNLLGPKLAAKSEDGPTTLQHLWITLRAETRKAGHLVIKYPQRYPNLETPSPAKMAWDNFVKALREASTGDPSDLSDEDLLARAEEKLKEGDVVGYWTVLAETRPLAGLALRVVKDEGWDGKAANDRVRLKALQTFGQAFTDTQMKALQLLVADAYSNVRRDKLDAGHGIGLTSKEVIEYHKDVFEKENFPPKTFTPEVLAKVVGPLWTVPLNAETQEVMDDGYMLTALRIYVRERFQELTDPVTFYREWLDVLVLVLESAPGLAAHLTETISAAEEALLEAERVREAEN